MFDRIAFSSYAKKIAAIFFTVFVSVACQTLDGSVSPDWRIGGQPKAEDLAQLQKEGFQQIINLRTSKEMADIDEAEWAAKLGMTYTQLPIGGGDDLTEQNARAFDALLKNDEPTYVHCASGNRVGALFALRAYYVYGYSAEDALAIGKANGLTRLEPKVREILQLAP